VDSQTDAAAVVTEIDLVRAPRRIAAPAARGGFSISAAEPPTEERLSRSGELGAQDAVARGGSEHTLNTARLGDHIDRLYRAAWALCGSREDAEDLVQETYARVLARPRLLRNEDDLGYLLRALRNTFLNQKRTESRRLRPGPLPEQLDLVADPRALQPQAALEAGQLYRAIAPLPADCRDVLVAAA